MIISTTPSLEGYKITKYLDVAVCENSALVECSASLHQKGLENIKRQAIRQGGDAIVGLQVSYFYSQLMPHEVHMVTTGTIVSLAEDKLT